MSDTEKLKEAKAIIEELTRFWMENPNWYRTTEKAIKFLRENK